MATEIKMPRLSQTTEEVRLIRWLVSVGDSVRKGQALCEVENDKTTMEVESFASGMVLRLQGEPDTVISAGEVIAILGEPGEKTEAEAAASAAPSASRPAHSAPTPSAAIPRAPSPPLPEGIRATPLVFNLARKYGVDLSRIRGTGARGLITKSDLEAYRAGAAAPAAPAAAQPVPPSATEYPLTGHQKAVARSVTAAKIQVPHYYLKSSIFADNLLAWRETHRRADGDKVAFDAILAWACAQALVRHPKLNGTFREDRILMQPQVHVGVAVAAGEELHVPVLHDAQAKDILTLDRELAALTAKARAGRLALPEISGGTVTITNLGMYPVEDFAAVLNAPQLVILAAGRARRELVVEDSGSLRVRSLFSVTGSFDHRAVNGAQGAAFLADVKKIIEEQL